MKSIKRILSIVLSISLLLSLTAGLDLSAYAKTSSSGENNLSVYPVIELGGEYEVNIENGDVYAYYQFTPEEDVTAVFTSYGECDTYGYIYQGSVSENNKVAQDDDSGSGANFSIVYDFEAGKTYIFAVKEYSEQDASFTIKLTEMNVESISYAPVEPYEIIENTNGYWSQRQVGYYDETDDEWYYEYEDFFYYYYDFKVGDVLTVSYKDGRVIDYSYTNEEESGFVSEDGDFISTEDVLKESYQYNNHWVVDGEYNYFTVSYMGWECQVDVKIIENPVESIEFIPLTSYSAIENINGGFQRYWNYDTAQWEEFFYYDMPIFQDGDKLVVHNNDSTTVTYVYSRDADVNHGLFHSENDSFVYNGDDENGVLRLENNQFDEHWVVGENYFTLEYMGKICEVPFVVEQNPIATVTLKLSKPYEAVESTNGYWTQKEIEYYDEENNEWYYEYEDYYRYYIPYLDDGDTLTIEYKNGETITYVYGAFHYDDVYDWGFISEDGELLQGGYYFSSEQEIQPWDVGEHYFKFYFQGVKALVPASIIENPIASITYNHGEPYQLIENSDGEWCMDWEINEKYFSYNTIFKDGDVITIEYNDGRDSVDYVYTLIEGEDGWNHWDFVSEDGDTLDEIDRDDNQSENHWYPNGEDYYFTISYLGISTEVPVEFVETPVASIELIPVKPYQYIEYTHGWWNDSGEEENEHFYYELEFNVGDTLVVNYKDGTQEEFINTEFEDERDDCTYCNFVSSDGTIIGVESNQLDEPWGLGDHYFEISYLGVPTSVLVKIVETPVASISASPSKVKHTFDDWYRCQKFDLTINYKDGTSKTVEDVISNDLIDGMEVDVRVDNLDDIAVGKDNEFTIIYANCETTSTFEIVDEEISVVDFEVKQIKDISSKFLYKFFDECLEYTIEFSDGTVSKTTKIFIVEGGLGGCRGDIIADYLAFFEISSEDDGKLKEGSEIQIRIGDIEKTFTIQGASHTHSYVVVDSVDATCTTDGKIVYECEDCGDTYEEIINASHSYKFVEAKNGILTYNCSVCGDKLNMSVKEVMANWSADVANQPADVCPVLDVVPDGIINAKDYAKLLHIK